MQKWFILERKHGSDTSGLLTSNSDDEENYDRVRDEDDAESGCHSKSVLQGETRLYTAGLYTQVKFSLASIFSI